MVNNQKIRRRAKNFHRLVRTSHSHYHHSLDAGAGKVWETVFTLNEALIIWNPLIVCLLSVITPEAVRQMRTFTNVKKPFGWFHSVFNCSKHVHSFKGVSKQHCTRSKAFSANHIDKSVFHMKHLTFPFIETIVMKIESALAMWCTHENTKSINHEESGFSTSEWNFLQSMSHWIKLRNAIKKVIGHRTCGNHTQTLDSCEGLACFATAPFVDLDVPTVQALFTKGKMSRWHNSESLLRDECHEWKIPTNGNSQRATNLASDDQRKAEELQHTGHKPKTFATNSVFFCL